MVPDEAQDVDELVQRAYARYVERIGRRPGPMEEDYAEKVAQDLVFVADEAGDVVGLIVLVQEPDHLLVENVAVAPLSAFERLAIEVMPTGSPLLARPARR